MGKMIVSLMIYFWAFLLGVKCISLGRKEKEPGWIWGGGILIGFFGFICFLIFIFGVADFLGELWWYESLEKKEVFLKMIKAKWGLFGIGSIISGALTALVLGPIFRLRKKESSLSWWLIALIAFSVAMIFGGAMMCFWKDFLLWKNYEFFGEREPIFGRDVSFYLLKYPFLREISIWFKVLIVTLVIVASFILFEIFLSENVALAKRAKIVFSGLITLLVGASIWRTKLKILGIVFSGRGAITGAGYTDVHLQLPCYKIYIGILIFVLVLWWLGTLLRLSLRKKLGWYLGVAVFWFFSWLILVLVIPGFYQSFKVRPNELVLEKKYIQYHIAYTRKAFGLENVKKSDRISRLARAEEVERAKETLSNVRLWDFRALQSTLQQIQALRWYYRFNDVDIDRYRLGNEYRQVMLTARELDVEALPERAKTWINTHLKYTHGYGVCVVFSNEFTEEGLPHLIVKDIPPRSEYKELEIERPEIYFGELTDRWVIVKTKEKEFDYPLGEENVYCEYKGKAGVPLSSFGRRLVYMLKLQSLKILISNRIEDSSRLLLYREIKERIRKLAPYLELDEDPYIVVAKGRLYWIVDAYTSSRWYPCSEKINLGEREINYFRNSVKIVVDAYSGKVKFYIFDREPVILAYRKAFPSLYSDKEGMPKELREHIRYPDKLFKLQAKIWAIYHMDNAQVFYNREDVWELPKELYIGEKIEMLPYFVIVKLPGEKSFEFINMIPFVPLKKQNLVAWMVARCDGENYGKLIVYPFEKRKLLFGPEQIEARIDQDKTISAQITLWNQQGSQVIRGNLLLIPLGESLFYLEPIYLQATNAKMPELKQVVVATEDGLAWAENLEKALSFIAGVGKVRKIEKEAKKVTPREKIDEIIGILKKLIKEMEELKKLY